MSIIRFCANYPFYIIRQAFSSTAVVTRQLANPNKGEVQAEGEERRVFRKERGNDAERPKKDKLHRRKVTPELSIKYMESEAFKKAYGNEVVWTHYRRNFKGTYPGGTRRTCVRNFAIATGSPCPICRDKYLVVDYRNTKLLEQFISPFSGGLFPTSKTQICQVQQEKLRVAIQKARDYGLLTFGVPHRKYDYSVYMPENLKNEEDDEIKKDEKEKV